MFGLGKKRPEDSDALTQPLPSGWSLDNLGLLGAGGMSRVYRVRDATLTREVALKVMRPELLVSDEAVQRFIEEARITAQLDHPNIPPVYALGADKKATCFTMKVLGGQSLQRLLEENEREGVDGLLAALDVLVRVCDAVAFAHSKGVLHLDLKPSNVMVGEFGQIYVVDWGVARRKAELPTKEDDDGAKNGTPAYMAPEQARGENWRLDERTDVFALGGVLYRILTGHPPYQGSSADQVLQAAAAGAVVPPERHVLKETLNRRLVTIALKALQTEPMHRHQSVAALKAELDEYIRGFAQLPRRTFKAGEVIIREGEEGDAAFVIFSGQCQASRQVSGFVQNLRVLGPGEMFGETAVFASAPRSASVTALTDVEVGVVDQLFLREEMERTSFMSLAIRTVAAGFLDLDAQTAAATEGQRRTRALELTLRHLALHGTPTDDGGKRTPWAPLLERLATETGLTELTLSARVLRDAGLSLEGEWLVLRA